MKQKENSMEHKAIKQQYFGSSRHYLRWLAPSLIVFCPYVFCAASSAQDADEALSVPPPPEQSVVVPPGQAGYDQDRPFERRRAMRRRFAQDYDGAQAGQDRMRRDGPGGGPEHFQRMGKFLHLVEQYQGAVQDPYRAVGLAVLGIKQHYKKTGKPLEAVTQFEESLKGVKDQKMRNIFLFAIKQTYEETKDQDKLLAINKQIVEENLRAVAK
jgi:hypothetical protein